MAECFRYWLVHLVVDYFVFMLSVALCALSAAHAALRIDPIAHGTVPKGHAACGWTGT